MRDHVRVTPSHEAPSRKYVAGSGTLVSSPPKNAASVPLTRALLALTDCVAVSSKVRLTLLQEVVPPVSDMINAVCPPGPTSRNSKSLGR